MIALASKADELKRKLSSLPDELKTWLAVSEQGQPFEKHHTQIRRLFLQITGLHETVVAEFDARFADGRLLAFADSIDKRSLAVHTVWDFLRSKFALRMVEPAARYLKTADAFALECYAGPSAISREPPLVTFDNQASPWAISRDHAYQPATDPGGFLSLAAFSQVIHSLPIPLLGLPWHYATYLPHMVFLAHEVGHAAERDFGLEPSLTAALDKSGGDPDHLHGWRSWQREVFADLFAIFTTGMPSAVSLAEILRADPERLQSAARNDGQWTDYPTAALRILLNAEALKQCGVADAEAFRDSWLALSAPATPWPTGSPIYQRSSRHTTRQLIYRLALLGRPKTKDKRGPSPKYWPKAERCDIRTSILRGS